MLRLYKNERSEKPSRTLKASECECEVGEREACHTDHYCFRLKHADGVVTLCALSSKELLLWLQALQAGGVKYEDPPISVNAKSLFEFRAQLLSSEEISLERLTGCVCLVVNAASR